jgi:hypothetical protein
MNKTNLVILDPSFLLLEMEMKLTEIHLLDSQTMVKSHSMVPVTLKPVFILHANALKAN